MSRAKIVDENGIQIVAERRAILLSDGTNLEGIKGGATVNPRPGPLTPMRNRMLVGITGTWASSTHAVHWPAGADITYLTFFAQLTAGSTAGNDEYAIATIDAANDTEAEANLGTGAAPPASTTADAQFIVIPLNTLVSVPLSDALSQGLYGGGRVDVRAINGGTLDIWIGAN